MSQPALAGCDGIDHQHGDGHRPSAAGHRRDVRGLCRDAGKIDVADESAVRKPVDTNVDHYGACSHHLRQDQIRMPGGGDQHVGGKRKLSQIAGLGVADATVASCCISNNAIGLSTMLLAPTTTTFLPSTG